MIIMQSTVLATTHGAWALITGASDGIGRATALELASQGLDVILVARRENLLREVGQACEALGRRTLLLALDLAAHDAAARVDEATLELDVGILIAAAGFGTSGPFVDNARENELEMVDVNCRATADFAHRFGKRFAQRGRGALVLFSSIVAFQGVPLSANYAATKAYVQSLAEGLRVELRAHGVQVIACAPGPVHTGFAKRAGMVLGNAATPEEVARAIASALRPTRLRAGTIRPGFLAKLLGFALSTLPRWGRIRVMTLIMRGMAQRDAPHA